MTAQDQNQTPALTQLIDADRLTVLIGDDQFPLNLGDDDYTEELAALTDEEPGAVKCGITAVEFDDDQLYDSTATVPAQYAGVIMNPGSGLNFEHLAAVPVRLLDQVAAITVAVYA